MRRADRTVLQSVSDCDAEYSEILPLGISVVLAKLESRWAEFPAAISEDETARSQFLSNARGIYLEVIGDALGIVGLQPAVVETVARARAEQRIAPACSIRAAELLHNIVMESVRELVPVGVESARLLSDISSASLKIFMRTMAAAADEHTSALLREVTQSHASERRRISRELHDQTGTGLAVVHRHLELARLCLGVRSADDDQLVRSLDIALGGVVETMKSIREILAGLRQDEYITSLRSALESFLATSPGSSRITIDVTGDESRLSDEIRREAFLMMREVLRNAERHAEASIIALSAEVRRSHLWVRVRDDGKGIAAQASPGTGMTSLRERASLLGGRVEWIAPRAGGTTVVITIPLADAVPSIARALDDDSNSA